MDTLLQDLRYGLRVLARAPLFTAVAVLSLALGIGANTTIFTLLKAVFLSHLGVQDPARLVSVFTLDQKLTAGGGPAEYWVSYPNFLDFRSQNQVFAGMSAYQTVFLNLSRSDGAEQITAEIVSGNYFELLGVRPALGRTFLPEEDSTPGTHPVVVLSHEFWRTRYGGDPRVLGRMLKVNNHELTIVGVAAAGFSGVNVLGTANFWVPMAMHDQILTDANKVHFDNRRALLFSVAGRLKPGFSRQQAEAEMKSIAARLEREYPVPNEGRSVALRPFREATIPFFFRDAFSLAGTLLAAVVGLVLLIACANVANLLLARATGRRKEIATRLALGTGRGRLLRQLLTESLLLSLLGGALGLLLSFAGPRLLWAHRPPFLSFADLDLGLDLQMLGFTLALSVVTGLLFGLAPALQASNPGLILLLREQTSSVTGKPGRRVSAAELLVVAQIALALIALLGSALFLRSLAEAQAIKLGFDANRLCLLTFEVTARGYDQPRGEAYYRQAVERASALPGVTAAALSSHVPVSMIGSEMRSAEPEGQGSSTEILAVTAYTSPGLLKTLGVPLAEGRDFDSSDRAGSLPVAIVNESLARRLGQGAGALGKRFHFHGEKHYFSVVGVARDSKYLSLGETSQAYIYLPLSQNYTGTLMTLFVRAAGDPAPVLGSVQREIRALDREMPLTNVWTFGEVLDQSLWAPRIGALLLGLFGLVALLLTVIGIYGVVSYSVAQRQRELGIRMAMGADRAQVLRLVLRRGMLVAGAGIAVGIAVSFYASRLIAGFLFLSPTDTATYAATAAILAAIALLANAVPARRASRFEPMRILRDG